MDAALLRAAYDREAARYEARFSAQQEPKVRRLGAHVPPPPPSTRVLDLGAGTGLLSRTLVLLEPAWAAARWTSLDLSVAMLARGPGVRVAADARRLPFLPATFGVVLSLTGIVAAEHLVPALVAAARVLADGGTLACTLRPGDVPAELPELLPRLPFELRVDTDAAGDRLLIFHRRARG
jgi:ubiquinone/menaquinone biosynthesis C-methylase UbiE